MRADAERNKASLVEAAKAAFTEHGIDASLEAIAASAGVGIGTLYRHFPTRDAVVAAVYRHEVEQLIDSAKELVARHPPLLALRKWLATFVKYMQAKRVMAAVAATVSKESNASIRTALGILAKRAHAAKAIRADIGVEELMQTLAGLAYGYSTPGWEARARRYIEVIVDGLARR